MKFKLLSTGNVIVANQDFMDACHFGDYEPIIDAERPLAAARRLTKLDYMNRFNDDELAAIYAAAKAVPAIEVWLAKFNAATPGADGTAIDLDDPRTVAGVQALEGAGLIGAGRAAEILA